MPFSSDQGYVQKFAPLFRIMEDGNVNLLVPDGCERVLQSFKKRSAFKRQQQVSQRKVTKKDDSSKRDDKC